MTITLYENFRAVFYTPFYLPQALGAFAAEGIDVNQVSDQYVDYRTAHHGHKTTDTYWGGPMRLMVAYDNDPNSELVAFFVFLTRDPFFLLGRDPNPGFAVAELMDRKLGSVSEVPTPWMCLQDDLRRAGCDPDAVERVADKTMAENVAALRDGALDVIQVFQPFAEDLVASGDGHIWYAAANRGACSYTMLYTHRATLAAEADSLRRMTRAMYRCQKWLHAQPAAEVAGAVADRFPDVSREILTACIDRYKALGIWGKNPRLPAEGYDRLMAAMHSGGLIGKTTRYERCVDTTIADAVIAEDPPSM